jgi:hypothetical protein
MNNILCMKWGDKYDLLILTSIVSPTTQLMNTTFNYQHI